MSELDNQVGILRNPFKSVPLVTSVLSAAVVLLYILSRLSDSFAEAVALVPAHIFGRFYFWQLLSSALTCISIVDVFIAGITIVLCGKALESVWGPQNFARFCVVAALGGSLTTYFVVVASYYVTDDTTALFHQYGGSGGLVGGFLVALKQHSPDHSLELMLPVSIRHQYLPLLFVSASLVFTVLTGVWFDMVFTAAGTFTAWLYLRFFQENSDGSRGDHTQAFSFESFFPEMFRPVLKPVIVIVYGIASKARVFKIQEDTSASEKPGSVKNAPITFSADPVDAERRRARALRALDQRMMQISAQPEVPLEASEKAPGGADSPV